MIPRLNIAVGIGNDLTDLTVMATRMGWTITHHAADDLETALLAHMASAADAVIARDQNLAICMPLPSSPTDGSATGSTGPATDRQEPGHSGPKEQTTDRQEKDSRTAPTGLNVGTRRDVLAELARLERQIMSFGKQSGRQQIRQQTGTRKEQQPC
ncbi:MULTISPECIES: hypothetical protein [Bifidobacterium]|uniref:Uncharacterized protein n=2 Tax=Bifidobacterium TaxID=1678 RepID=A0A261FNP9_9BIFI|nr:MULTISPECIES: hypothetical protein [Bifidobacterium]OZG60718.1 hypothetical protein BLEM_1687 [Bifidobacterium lemurum]OZG69616.1 hypothetical protein BEUL_0033 [Bifidobacterium eulemuris]QOL32267.1 hypothetical protein BE0216_07225 [Bifidobacterium eulemuris]QOL35227.1 hypothetical protein BL8807_05090 [Bifidobacterium lemurum]